MYLFRIGLSFRCDQLGLLFFFFLEAFYKALAAGKSVVESHAVAQASVRHSANLGIRHESASWIPWIPEVATRNPHIYGTKWVRPW